MRFACVGDRQEGDTARISLASMTGNAAGKCGRERGTFGL